MKILTPLQVAFLNAFFSSAIGKRFFLTGGTALTAFYLKHRLSEDLDLFTLDKNISFDRVNAQILKIADSLSLHIKHQISSPDFLQYILESKKETLKVDIVKDVPIHFGETKNTQGFVVDSLENIATGKLLALFGRAGPKDFVDLYFLLRDKHIGFDELFQFAKKKDLGLHELYLAEMVSRVEAIDIFPKTFKPFDQDELVKFFLKIANRLYQKIKPPQ